MRTCLMSVTDNGRRVAGMVLLFVVGCVLTARSAQATPMTWTLSGTTGVPSGIFADYLTAGAPVTLTFTADGDQAAEIPPYCPPEAHAAEYRSIGSTLQIGALA